MCSLNASVFSMKCSQPSSAGVVSSLLKISCGTAETGNLDGGAGLRRRRPALGAPVKWSSFHLTYEFTFGFPQQGKPPVERTIKEWERRSNFTFSERSPEDSNPADVKIGMHRGSHGDGNPFDGGDELAHAFYPTDGRLHFDGAQPWSYLRQPPRGGGDFFDLESVALHEMGHVLGLRHSSRSSDVMYWSILPCQIKRSLTANDVERLRSLYMS